MKLLFFPLLLVCFAAQSQINSTVFTKPIPVSKDGLLLQQPVLPEDIRIAKPMRWKLDKNKWLTGGLLFTAGFAKGFNEGLQYKYNGFEAIFPHADDQWFYPTFSYLNKYKDHDPSKGAKFPMSTSVLVMFTDQYHLNNFIQKSALTAALVLKIGDGKKPFKHYVLDVLYYSACYLAGFHMVYQPISMKNE